MTTHFLKSILLIALIGIISCEDSNTPDVLECPNNALHTVNNAKGTMVYLTCYEAWGVELDDTLVDDAVTIGGSLDVDEAYKIEGLRVSVDACFYEFDLPLILPDPQPWGYLFRMEDFRIIEE